MRILSWNILHGGGSRTSSILEAIARHDPDLLTLQEVRSIEGRDPLIEGLDELGLRHRVLSPTSGPRQNGVLVAARRPFEAAPFSAAIGAGGGTAGAPVYALRCHFEGKGAEPPLQLIAVRFPQKQDQVPLFEALLALPSAWRLGSSLLIGDFNCGIPFEDSETRTFACTAWFQQLLRQGWIDAWRRRHRQGREFSWISRPQGHGFRYDHALVSPELDQRITAVTYDHEVRTEGHSDHSALLLEA
jgi:exodeoxyribonuclease-3